MERTSYIWSVVRWAFTDTFTLSVETWGQGHTRNNTSNTRWLDDAAVVHFCHFDSRFYFFLSLCLVLYTRTTCRYTECTLLIWWIVCATFCARAYFPWVGKTYWMLSFKIVFNVDGRATKTGRRKNLWFLGPADFMIWLRISFGQHIQHSSHGRMQYRCRLVQWVMRWRKGEWLSSIAYLRTERSVIIIDGLQWIQGMDIVR